MEKYRLIQEQKLDEIPTTTPSSTREPPPTGDATGNLLRRKPSTSGHHHSSDTTSATVSTSNEYPEVRITQQGKPRNYISYAMNLLVRARTVEYSYLSLHLFRRVLSSLSDVNRTNYLYKQYHLDLSYTIYSVCCTPKITFSRKETRERPPKRLF